MFVIRTKFLFHSVYRKEDIFMKVESMHVKQVSFLHLLMQKSIVDDIAKDLCAFFHQESVLVTESQIQARFIRETLE